ncbi:MAG: cytochrome-c peroxidase [Sandaracinaceae bacterium]
MRGAAFFFGAGRCSTCHRGASLSDFRAHNTAVPQVGPGIGDGPAGNDDFGFEHVSGDPRTRYAFRTTPLRNVELTAPYGHDGAYVTLGAVLSHYRDPRRELEAYDASVPEPVLRDTLVPNHDAMLATLDPLMQPVPMGAAEMTDLRAFMGALTDASSRDLLSTIPDRVPSGLPVAD